ncbi:MAG: methyltransferase domain-containing protein [Rhodobacteraceae bacterium]|nr:methyltransferase domain-containing protein [Paracoccaceae bacterium]
MSALGIDARLAATQILHGVLFDKRLMSDLLGADDGPIARLSGPERARAQALATGVLRHLAALDAVLDAFLDRPTPLKVRNALRLAAFEMLAEGVAAHGAVNAAVAIVRGSAKAGNLAGLTNAVGRRIAEGGAAIWKAQPPQALPSWLAKPVAKNFGRQVVGAIEVAHGRGAAFDLTLKAPAEAADWAARLEADILPTGSLRLKGRPQLTALPGFETGDWWVQDAAAALPARLLGDIAGARVLDLCAAPGGKTLQLAAAGAAVTALDLSSERLDRLSENLQRTGLSANVVTADVLSWTPDAPFDAVLLDAPCSATGTIRRHPDLPFARAGADMSGLFQVQADMIDAALAMLKPGGRLVYCTCSLLPREGEVQIADALKRHPGLTVMPPDLAALGVEPGWLTAEGGLRLRPDYWADRGGMDGFYMALLQRGAA